MILTNYNEYTNNYAVIRPMFLDNCDHLQDTMGLMYEKEFTEISNQNQLAGYHYRSFTLQIYNCLICNVYSSRTIENASSDQETKSRHIVFAHRINGRESTRWFL